MDSLDLDLIADAIAEDIAGYDDLESPEDLANYFGELINATIDRIYPTHGAILDHAHMRPMLEGQFRIAQECIPQDPAGRNDMDTSDGLGA